MVFCHNRILEFCDVVLKLNVVLYVILSLLAHAIFVFLLCSGASCSIEFHHPKILLHKFLRLHCKYSNTSHLAAETPGNESELLL